MTLLDILSVAIGVAGVLFGARCYSELWRWAKVSQRAQIAVAYKNKVKICHPIQEWMLMVNLLKPGETGRTVYSLGGTRVAIIRGGEIQLRRDLWRFLRHRKPQPTGAGGMQVRSGAWEARDDKTGAKGGSDNA